MRWGKSKEGTAQCGRILGVAASETRGGATNREKNTKNQKEHQWDWSIFVSRERDAKRAWEQSTIPATVRILVNQRQAHYNALLSITRVWEPLLGHVHTAR